MMSAPVMFLLGGAAVFGRLLTLQRIPEMLATAMLGLSSSKYVVMLLIMAFLLVAGMFIDTTSNIVLFAPLFCPIAQKLGLDLVYFGILMVVNLWHRLPDAAAGRQPVRRKEYIRCAIGRVGQRTDAIHRHPRSGARPDGLLPADRHVPAKSGRRMTPDTQNY